MPPPKPKHELVRNVARLLRVADKQTRKVSPRERERVMRVVAESLQGIPRRKVIEAGIKAGLSPDDMLALDRGVSLDTPAKIGTVLEILDRPGQAVKGFIQGSEGSTLPWNAIPRIVDKGPGGFLGDVREGLGQSWKGLSGQKKFEGAVTLGTAATGSRKTGEKFAESLPGPARIVTDFTADFVFDPTTYVAVGGGKRAVTGARTVAKTLTAETVDDLTRRGLSPAAQRVFTEILTKGRQALPEEVYKNLPGELRRAVTYARPGVYVARRRVIPLPQSLRTVGPRIAETGEIGAAAATERFLRPQAAARQAERTGTLPVGAADTVKQIVEGTIATSHKARLARRQVERGAAEIVGRTVRDIPLDEPLTVRGIKRVIKAGERELRSGRVDLDKVREALDVEGGPAAVSMLDPVERNLAKYLRGVTDETFSMNVEAGRLLPERRARVQAVQEVAGKFEKQIAKRARQVQRSETQLAKHQDALQSAVRALDEFNQASPSRITATERSVTVSGKGKLKVTEANALKRGEALRQEVVRLRKVVKQAERDQKRASDALVRLVERMQKKQKEAWESIIPSSRYYPVVRSREARNMELPVTARHDFIPDKIGFGVVEPSHVQKRVLRNVPASKRTLGDIPLAELDPIAAVAQHRAATVRDLANVSMIDDLSRHASAGKPLIVTGADIEKVKGTGRWYATYTEREIPITVRTSTGEPVIAQQRVLVHRSIIDDLDKVMNAPKDIPLKKAIRYVNAWIARAATATFGFVSRNVLQGNLYMGMVLAEARDPKSWIDAFRTFRRVNRGIMLSGDPFRFLRASERALVQQALDNGVFTTGFWEELVTSISKIENRFLKSRMNPLSTEFLPMERISALNRWMENWSRFAVFTDKVRKGFTPPDAASLVNHYMLDYSNVSQMNQVLREWVNPFITWVYKSTPMLISELLHSPRKVMIPLHALDAISAEGRRDTGLSILPDWMQESGAVVLPGELGLKGRIFIPDMPIHSLVDTLGPLVAAGEVLKGDNPLAWEDLARKSINVASPFGVMSIPRLAGELAAGEQFFSGKEIPRGEQVPAPVPFDKILGKNVSWETRNILETLVPFIARSAGLFPQTDYERRLQSKRLTSMLFGLSLPETKGVESTAVRQRVRLLEAMLRRLRSTGVKTADETPGILLPSKVSTRNKYRR